MVVILKIFIREFNESGKGGCLMGTVTFGTTAMKLPKFSRCNDAPCLAFVEVVVTGLRDLFRGHGLQPGNLFI